MKLLIDGGANVNQMNNNNYTALMLASYEGINTFLKLHWSKNERIVSLFLGHLEVVKLLIEKAAKVHFANYNQDTALILAAQNGISNVNETNVYFISSIL